MFRLKFSYIKVLFSFVSIYSIGVLSANENRVKKQADRIQDGVDSGALNKREQRRLEGGLEKIKSFRQGIGADGVVTSEELAIKKTKLDNLSGRIYDQKHDEQVGLSRREKQRNRIEDGVASGALTRKEERRLNNKMENIKDFSAEIRADGVVTSEERAERREMRDDLSGRIYDQKHDAQIQGLSRRERQRNRIDAGVESGAINEAEAAELNGNMKEIRNVRQGVKADGEVNSEERAYIQTLRDQNSARIKELRHNDETINYLPEPIPEPVLELPSEASAVTH